MRVLDIDLDYFLDAPVCERNHDSDERVNDVLCIESVWSERRVRDFLENKLGLSKSKKIKGCILKGHDEALYYWEKLISNNKLVAPFSVVHIDSHPDLGFGGIGKCFVLTELLLYPLEYRFPRFCKDYELDGRYYKIDIGDYLLFGLGFRWFTDIVYCANPNCDYGAIPDEILMRKIPDGLEKPTNFYIQLRCRDNVASVEEPRVPLLIIPTVEAVEFDGNFDFISIAQSPNYTPANADFIIDIFREYLDESGE